MCSIVLRISETGVLIGANRDEMLARAWDPPGQYWPALPGVVAGRDRTAGGTWLGMNRQGMVAAVLDRKGTLGPAAGKRSRGELVLDALDAPPRLMTTSGPPDAPDVDPLPGPTFTTTSGALDPLDPLDPFVALVFDAPPRLMTISAPPELEL